MNERMSLESEPFPQPTDTVMTLNLAEVRALWKIIKHESINPNENPLFRGITHKFFKLMNQYGE